MKQAVIYAFLTQKERNSPLNADFMQKQQKNIHFLIISGVFSSIVYNTDAVHNHPAFIQTNIKTFSYISGITAIIAVSFACTHLSTFLKICCFSLTPAVHGAILFTGCITRKSLGNKHSYKHISFRRGFTCRSMFSKMLPRLDRPPLP